MCVTGGGGIVVMDVIWRRLCVRSILLLPLVARDNRCMYMAYVCFYVSCCDCVGVWECLLCSVCC